MKDILLNYTYEELFQLLKDDMRSYQIKQLYFWLSRGVDFDEMTDLSKELRNKLNEKYIAQPIKIIQKLEGKDKTEKYLYELYDGNVIEGVKMSYKYGNTLCVSTQVGCRMGCTFCASTLNGLVRNLSAGEILGQVTIINKLLGGNIENRKLTNIVLMGSGEPLDNFDNVIKFLHLVNSENGLNIAMRNISLSTCGIVPKIDELAQMNMQITLTISLHNAFNDKRMELMPIAKAYSINELVGAMHRYFDKTGRRIIVEYTLISGKNDSDEDAKRLSELLRGMSVHINLIRLNRVKERDYKASSKDKAEEFLAKLLELKMSATLRRQMGVDIDGACGQLRQKHLENL
ncbi:MAG: 23S rRNA (adenine(2503)-C(2))-methyltransferase RlmN [Clostridia bacterium]